MNSSTEKICQTPELQENLQLLGELPCFATFPPKAMKLLAFLAERYRFADGDLIFEEGDDFGRLYLLLAGHLRLLAGKGQNVVCEFRPKEFLGTFSLLGRLPALFSLEATTASTVLSISREQLAKVVEQFPECANSYLHSLLRELHRWEARSCRRVAGGGQEQLGVTVL